MMEEFNLNRFGVDIQGFSDGSKILESGTNKPFFSFFLFFFFFFRKWGPLKQISGHQFQQMNNTNVY